MHAPASAYAALGLEPDADRATIERAYRELIKRYHPDRSGGDAARAAEINRAYFELRHQDPHESSDFQPFPASHARRRPGRRKSRRRSQKGLWPVLLIAVGLILIIERERLAAQVPHWIAALEDLQPVPLSAGRPSAVSIDSDALEGALNETAIARSIQQAQALAERGDEAALAQQSRDCHRRMRAEPDLEQLDRCAAFDDAVAAIGDRDPMNDMGVFNASAITARQMTAAALLSSDFLAIERRLDRIRSVVQLSLRPAPPPAVPIRVEPEAARPVEPEPATPSDGL